MTVRLIRTAHTGVGYELGVEIDDDGHAHSWQTSGQRVGRFARDLSTRERRALTRALTSARAAPAAPARAGGPVRPSGATEQLVADDLPDVVLTPPAAPPTGFGGLVRLLRTLREDLAASPVAGIELHVAGSPLGARLRHVGSEPVAVHAGTVTVETTAFGPDNALIGSATHAVTAGVDGPVAAGWELHLTDDLGVAAPEGGFLTVTVVDLEIDSVGDGVPWPAELTWMTEMTGTASPGKSIASLLGAPPDDAGPARRLSESSLWDRQRRFYAGDASSLWGTATVPHAITANPRIAHTYARLAREFLRAAGPAAGDADVPHLVELGGGSGRFAYLFVTALHALAPDLRFTYVLTDFSPERVASWVDHPSFRPLVEHGLLDVAVLDADHPGPLELLVSGRTLTPGSLRAPVIGIANYVLDTLRHDGYAIHGGELTELRVAASDDGSALRWEAAPCGPVPDDVAPVLEHYRATLDDTAVLVPTGGMRCLEYLAALTTGPSCALVADKGHATPVELCSHAEPSVVFHGGGFSLMVNFDFLARWVRGRGGVAVLPAEPARSLVVAAFVHGAVDDQAQLTRTVQDQLLDAGPDNWFAVRPLLGAAAAVEPMLAALRLSRFDPTLLIELLPGLLEVLPTVPDAMRSEVERVLLRVWQNWFPIGEPIDVALCVGLAFSAMERYARAVDFLEMSVKEHPDSAPAAFAMAVARRGLRDLRAALQWADAALDHEPGFSEARTLRAVLLDELGEAGRDGWGD